jgi:branched-chain amino acid transport system permease protein
MMGFIENFIDGCLIGSVYSLIAIGFVLIYKASKVLNIAQGGLVLMGTYFSYAIIVQFGIPTILAIFMTLGLCVLVALLFERFPLRPLFGQPILSLIMATIGIELLIRGVITLVWGARGWRTYPPIFGVMPLKVAGLSLSSQPLIAFVVAIIIFFILALFFRKTKTGLLMRATAEGHLIAQSMGIRVSKIIAVSWGISAIISALGGIFLGSMINVNVALADIGLKAIAAVIVGGLESIQGALLGGILIGITESLAMYYIGHGSGEITPYIILMLILIYRPEGIFGLKIIERV